MRTLVCVRLGHLHEPAHALPPLHPPHTTRRIRYAALPLACLPAQIVLLGTQQLTELIPSRALALRPPSSSLLLPGDRQTGSSVLNPQPTILSTSIATLRHSTRSPSAMSGFRSAASSFSSIHRPQGISSPWDTPVATPHESPATTPGGSPILRDSDGKRLPKADDIKMILSDGAFFSTFLRAKPRTDSNTHAQSTEPSSPTRTSFTRLLATPSATSARPAPMCPSSPSLASS